MDLLKNGSDLLAYYESMRHLVKSSSEQNTLIREEPGGLLSNLGSVSTIGGQ